jgi:polysaccharide biosynthesis protein VpsJ
VLVEHLLNNLLRWLDQNGLASYDFCDALQSPLLLSITSNNRSFQRLAIQVVNRFPFNIRPMLRIKPHISSQTLAIMCSARAWQYVGGWKDISDQQVRDTASMLINDRLEIDDLYLWGLKFPFSSRYVQSNSLTPNLFQTSNSIHALLDAYQAVGDVSFADAALKAADSCCRYLGIVNSKFGLFCRYYPGLDAPIYNVNALLAAALLRLALLNIGNARNYRSLAEGLLDFILKGQRHDGSWPYGADKSGQWVDGFHSGYILEALGYFWESEFSAAVRRSVAKGVEFFEGNLIEADGCPKYYVNSRYPVDVQNCAQAIQTTARLLPLFSDHQYILTKMINSVVNELYIGNHLNSGYFAANRTRLFLNKTAYVRWGQAPMVLALTHAWSVQANRNKIS